MITVTLHFKDASSTYQNTSNDIGEVILETRSEVKRTVIQKGYSTIHHSKSLRRQRIDTIKYHIRPRSDQKIHTQERQEASPFPADDHNASCI